MKNYDFSTDCSGPDDDTNRSQLPGAFQRYHNVRYLKSGGQAKIYLAEDTQQEFGTVAIKVPATVDDHSVNSFLAEASVASAMRHPNVVKVLDSGRINGQIPFLVMKFFAGGALADLLARDPKRHSREAVQIARQIANAAQYVCEKRGLVHCDIKPQNILLDEAGCPHLADFGVVSANAGQPLGAVKGTWMYMSPEQATGGNVDARSDVWSIGVILYQMLCGRLPFQGDNLLSQIAMQEPIPPRQIDGKIAAAVEHIVLKCLKKHAGDRYGSPIELSEALRAAEAPWRKPALLAAAVLLLVLGGGVLKSWQSSGRQDANADSKTNDASSLKQDSHDAAVPPSMPLPASLQNIAAVGTLTEVLTGSPAGDSKSAVRPELTISIFANRQGTKEWEPLKDDDALVSNTDSYFLNVEPVSDGYLYIFQVDSLGQQSWLFPQNKTSEFSTGENPVRAGDAVQVPPEQAFFLDGNPGIERIFVVFSSVRWPKLESALLERSTKTSTSFAPPAVEIKRLSRGVAGKRPRETSIVRRENGNSIEILTSTEAVQAKGKFLVIERRFRHIDQ